MKIETEFNLGDEVYGIIVKHVPISYKAGCDFCGQTGKIRGVNGKKRDCPACERDIFYTEATRKVYEV